MPFCTQCGTQVGDTAAYCGHCGTAQPRAGGGSNGSGQAPHDFLDGITERNASILCYIPVFGIIPSIIFLSSQKFRHNHRVRFDGFQSIYLFVAYLIVSSAGPFFLFGIFHRNTGNILETIISICWIFLLVKAAQNEQVRLPIIGDLAERSASEQL